jgi:hypothetical protein
LIPLGCWICRSRQDSNADAWVVGQVAQQQIPELLIESSFGRIAVLVQGLEVSKNLLNALAPDV